MNDQLLAPRHRPSNPATFWCREASALHPYEVDETGTWWCIPCGIVVQCEDCGAQVHNTHACEPNLADMTATEYTRPADPTTPLNRDTMYALAQGYALGVWRATPVDVNKGITSDEDVTMFAVAYADHHHNLTAERQVPVWEAFGEWRYSGGIAPTD